LKKLLFTRLQAKDGTMAKQEIQKHIVSSHKIMNGWKIQMDFRCVSHLQIEVISMAERDVGQHKIEKGPIHENGDSLQ
jgi:hypothetical protein